MFICGQAIYKVPVAGWLQIFALAGAIEAEQITEVFLPTHAISLHHLQAKNLAFPTNYGYPPFWGQINKLSPEAGKIQLGAQMGKMMDHL